MPLAVGVVAQGDRIPMNTGLQQQPPPGLVMTTVTETFAKDAIISWFRGEFAAANAIIDALCAHLRQLEGGGAAEYESVFAAIHRRRLNWIPILNRQKYFSIAGIPLELEKVAAAKKSEDSNGEKIEKLESSIDIDAGDEVESPESEITDTGSQEVQPCIEDVDICSNHEECEARRAQIKITKGFIAKESVKGHMVNVVRGLKLYEDIFTHVELSKLIDLVNELRAAGHNGELSDETFVLYNQQVKGNKRELIQLGVPIFGQIKSDRATEKSCIEPIPALLESVIDHLIQWHLIPEHRKPNSCIINFFDEGEYSQPFLKPPHLEQPVSTLLLSESTMAFGRILVNDSEGNYRGPLMLSLKEGSLLVMRGNSADTARHVMCASQNKRVSITFFRVGRETDTESNAPCKALTTTLCVPTPVVMANGWEAMNLPVSRAPMVLLAPMSPIVTSPRRIAGSGTGVFLPWAVGSRKPAKHLPPRAQRRRLLSLTSSKETCEEDSGFHGS